jgi:hypothetical protein
MNPERPRYRKRDSEDIVVDRIDLLDGGRSQKTKGGLQRLVGSLRIKLFRVGKETQQDKLAPTISGMEVRNAIVTISLPNVLQRGIDASLGHILTRSMSLQSYRPRYHAPSRDLEASTVNMKWKGIMTAVGKGETIFSEPESVDMG